MELRTLQRVAPLPTAQVRRTGAPLLAAALFLTADYGLVLAGGGRPSMFTSLACLPIALGALVGGWRGGVAVALVAVTLFGPLMPIRAPGPSAAMALADWLVRSGEFLAAGVILGLFATRSARLATLLARERTEQAAAGELAASEARLRTALEAQADGILLFDSAGRLGYATRAAARLLGVDGAALLGLSYPTLAEHVGLVPAGSAGSLEGIPTEVCLGGTGPTGRMLTVSAAALDEGPVHGGFVLTLHETSAERALAREQAAHLEGLHEVAAELLEAPSAAAAGTALLAQLNVAWPIVAGAIYLFVGTGTERLATRWGDAPGPPAPLVPATEAAALRTLAGHGPARMPLVRLPGPVAGPALLAARGARSLLVLRLAAEGRTIGVLLAGDRQPPEALAPTEAAYLGRIADVAAGIVRRAVSDEEAARLAGAAAVDAILAAPERLTPHFQPIVALEQGRVVGYEALARIADAPPGGPPAWFAAAETAGRGAVFQALAIQRAREVARTAGLPRGAFLALNVSPRHLAHPAVADAFGRGSLRRVVVEVTEEEAVADYAALRSAMAPYRARGARFAVDDAGAGFASFRHVTEIAPDFVKLDAALVRDLRADPARAALVRALAGFAAEVGATTIAEGVETRADLADLRALGGQILAQGYALARPGAPWPTVAHLASAGPVVRRAAHGPRVELARLRASA